MAPQGCRNVSASFPPPHPLTPRPPSFGRAPTVTQSGRPVTRTTLIFFSNWRNDMLVNLTRAGHASALRVVPRSVLLHGASMSLLTVVRRACTAQSKLLQLAAGQSLQFTGMGGPMGVYENYDTCDPRARPLVPAAACCRPLLQALQALPGAQSRGRDRDAPCGCARRPGRRPCSAYCVRGWGRALGHLGGTIRGHLFFS